MAHGTASVKVVLPDIVRMATTAKPSLSKPLLWPPAKKTWPVAR